MDEVEAAVKKGQRFRLIELMGISAKYSVRMVGDFSQLTPVESNAVAVIREEKIPFLYQMDEGHLCTGATLCRTGKEIFAVPCFEYVPDEADELCAHCSEIFGVAPVQGDRFVMDPAKMPEAKLRYKKGKTGSLFVMPMMLKVKSLFEEHVGTMRKEAEKVAMSLPEKWPGWSFYDLAGALLTEAGVIYADSKRGSVKRFFRTADEQQRMCDYMKVTMELWLRAAITLTVPSMRAATQELVKAAKHIGKVVAAYARQREGWQGSPVGPIVASDIIRAALLHAAKRSVSFFAGKSLEEFSWGPGLEALLRFANTVPNAIVNKKWSPSDLPIPDSARESSDIDMDGEEGDASQRTESTVGSDTMMAASIAARKSRHSGIGPIYMGSERKYCTRYIQVITISTGIH